jgi:hypothetical protein
MIDFDSDTRSIIQGEFSELITLTFNEGSLTTSVEVLGIFDETYLELDPSTGAAIQSDESRVVIFEKEITEALHEKITNEAGKVTVTVESRPHLVFYSNGIEDDSSNTAVIRLKKRRLQSGT